MDLLTEAHSCFNYFFDNFTKDEHFGLMPDQVPNKNHVCSVAANGFWFVAMVVGAEHGYISRKQAEEYCSRALDTLLGMQHDNGFFYHFYFTYNAERANNSELSIIDTALLLAGALTAGSCFGGAVLKKARKLSNRINWDYFYDPNRKMFYMGRFDKLGFNGWWDYYAEQLIIYFLCATQPRYESLAHEAYYSFMRTWDAYGNGEKFIHTWFGSLFAHQFSHAFVDFRNTRDKLGVNWFDNSVIASLSNRQFCIDNAHKFNSYAAHSWGLTSCSTRRGYKGRIGAPPSGRCNVEHLAEGTVAPAGALGSIVFTPNESLQAMGYYSSLKRLQGKYGLYDAFNLNQNWYSNKYISIDKGITLAMIANYEGGIVWRHFNNLPEIKQAFNVLGINKEEK